MSKNQARVFLVVILLAAFFLRQYRLLDFPYHGDEVDEGDIAIDILHGHLAPYYPQNEGNEPLYQFSLTPFFAVLGDSVIANRFPSAAWGMIFVALMYTYGRVLLNSRRVGVMAAGLAASLWWSTIFSRLGLRDITQPAMMIPALLALTIILRDPLDRRAPAASVFGGVFAGLTAYTFLSGRGFPAIVILFLLYALLFQHDALVKRRRALLVYCILMIGISLPLYVYLYLHPDLDFHVRDLSAQSWLARRDYSALAPQLLGTLGMFTFRGDLNWVWNIPGRPVFVGPEGWIFYLGIIICAWRWRKPEYALQLIALATMLVPNVIVDNPPGWTRSIGILPTLITVTVLPIDLLRQWIEHFARVRWGYGALVLLLGISIYSRTAFDMFDVWIDHPGVYWMTLAYYDSAGKYINRSADTTPVNYVMDVYTDWRKHNVQRVAQRDDIQMRWSLKNAFVFPNDSRGVRVAFQIFGDPAPPLQTAFLDLDHPIYVDPRADPEGNRPLRIHYVPRTRLNEHLSRAKANDVFLPDSNTPVTGAIQVAEMLQFLGYELLNPTGRDELNLLTYWRVLRPLPDMAIFLHLLDSNGNVISQYDGFDVVSEDLKLDDVVGQLHALKLPSNLPTAQYRFELGAYTRSDLIRLSLSTGGDHLWLQTWTPPQ
jgi:hypothetical protein